MNYKKIAKAYAEYKAKEAEYKLLALKAVEEMEKSGIKKEETTYGIFTVAERKSYVYSPKVKELEEKVKMAKVKEEQKGVAKPQISTSLRYTPIKHD